MSAPVAVRASSYRVIFDGQSLNWSPAKPNNYPTKLLSGRGLNSANVAISGFAWVQLKNLINDRMAHHLLRAPITIVIGVGGTTDYALNRTGAQVYADEVSWANSVRAAGADYIIQTTTTPSTVFSGAQDSNRINGNLLVMADASNAFDYSVDLAGDPRLSNPIDTTYYNPDGTHPNNAGAQVIADLIAPALDSILSL
jgi:hypothetical protein